MLQNSEDDHEDLTAPMLVIAPVKKEDFRVQDLDKYTYQVYSMWCVLFRSIFLVACPRYL